MTYTDFPVEPADLDLTDYNAPMLGPAAPRDAKAARAMWKDLRDALRRLPGGADLIRLRKMPSSPATPLRNARSASTAATDCPI